MMRLRVPIFLFTSLVTLWLLCFPIAVAEPISFAVDVRPSIVKIDAFFKGADIFVSADIPNCDGAVVKMEGRPTEISFSKKGKVAFIWMSVAELSVRNIPEIYLMAVSDEISNFCSDEKCAELRIGYTALKKNAVFESVKPLDGTEFDEFLKFKKEKGAYRIDREASISLSPLGKAKLSSILHLPPTVSPGNYDIEVYCFQSDTLIGTGKSKITIEMVGLPKLMTDLAFQQPALHGIVAVIIAMIIGIIMGFIFSSRSGGAH